MTCIAYLPQYDVRRLIIQYCYRSHNIINETQIDILNYHLIIDNRTTSS